MQIKYIILKTKTMNKSLQSKLEFCAKIGLLYIIIILGSTFLVKQNKDVKNENVAENNLNLGNSNFFTFFSK